MDRQNTLNSDPKLQFLAAYGPL
ncbi:hypothetical protein A2U01_0089918, partial [Trifolium medium]|nr:hypothetical protein [Trifolium medium]